MKPQTPHPCPKPVKICPNCKGQLSQGVSHLCSRAERNINVLDLVRSLSDRSKGQVTSESLKGK